MGTRQERLKKLQMKLDSNKFLDISDKFIGVLFVLLKEKNSFYNCMLGLLFATERAILMADKLNISSKEQLAEVQNQLKNIAADSIGNNDLKFMDDLIKDLNEKKWEIEDESK